MNLHANVALSLNRRRLLCRRVVDEGWTVKTAAEAAEVSVRCARKWVGRYRSEGELGLLDRSSAPNTRLAYAEVLGDEKAITVVAFLRRAVAFFERHGMTVQQLLTDNGSGYRSMIHAIACRTLGIRHLRTRAYRPQTNGKAERFIRTLLSGWAYGAIYHNSHERTAALNGWLWYYNHHRKHSALSHKPPIARLNERTNPLSTYT